MNIQIAVLCDSAVEYQSRLCILGTFDTIRTHQLPATKPQCSIALQILWNKTEEGTHTIKTRFMDDDGNPTLKAVNSLSRYQYLQHLPSLLRITSLIFNN